MQIIAFDYGEKKIGVAVGQTSTNTSSPLQIIFNKDNNTNWTSISSLLNEWKPDLILLGKQLNMDGSESKIMKKVDQFYKELKSIYDVDIEFVDERLTTFEAREILKDERHDNVDAHAAKILIDSWFENSDKE